MSEPCCRYKVKLSRHMEGEVEKEASELTQMRLRQFALGRELGEGARCVLPFSVSDEKSWGRVRSGCFHSSCLMMQSRILCSSTKLRCLWKYTLRRRCLHRHQSDCCHMRHRGCYEKVYSAFFGFRFQPWAYLFRLLVHKAPIRVEGHLVARA